MRKRQRNKLLKQELEEEFSYCQNCGKNLDLKHNKHHIRYRTCNTACSLHMIGMSWSDFY